MTPKSMLLVIIAWGQSRFVADDAHFDAVFIRIDAEVIQDNHRLQPQTAADTLHADGFAPQLFRSLETLCEP